MLKSRNKTVILLMAITMTNMVQGMEEIHRRQLFEDSLNEIRRKVYDVRLSVLQARYNTHKPTIFISYGWEKDIELWVDQILSRDLKRIGFEVLYDQKDIMAGKNVSIFEDKVKEATYVIVVCTPHYLKRYKNHNHAVFSKHTGVGREMDGIVRRLKSVDRSGTVLVIYRKGTFEASVPSELRDIAAFNVDGDGYYSHFFTLCQSLFLYENNEAEPLKGIREHFLSLPPPEKKISKMQAIVFWLVKILGVLSSSTGRFRYG